MYGEGHGRSIELNMDYRGDMARGKRSLYVECRSHRVSGHMVHYSNSSLGGALKSPSKNRLFALTFACHGERTIAPRGA